MGNCPCVPYGKKCMFEEHAKDLLCCCCHILNYHLQELKMELPLIGGWFETYVCKDFMDAADENP